MFSGEETKNFGTKQSHERLACGWPPATGPAAPPRAVCRLAPAASAGQTGRAARRAVLAAFGAGAAAGKLNGGARVASRRHARGYAAPGRGRRRRPRWGTTEEEERGAGGRWRRDVRRGEDEETRRRSTRRSKTERRRLGRGEGGRRVLPFIGQGTFSPRPCLRPGLKGL